MNHHILWHAHFKSNSIHLPTIASIIYTKPPLSSWVLRKAWSMRKCSCKVASIAARLYCIQWLQTEIAHICISCMLPNKSREYFAFCMVLSVTQVKSAQSWEKTHFKPRATHTQLHLLHFILLCVCVRVCARTCVTWKWVKWVVECQQCVSVCPTERLNGSRKNTSDCTLCMSVCMCVSVCELLLTGAFFYWQQWSTVSTPGLAPSYYLIHWHFV